MQSFRCAADLRAHAVVHTKEKPFKCDACDVAFSQRATLKGERERETAWNSFTDL